MRGRWLLRFNEKETAMAAGNLPACLAVTLPHEGGWSDHPKDPGGATMRGVTLAVFRRWVPGASKADLRAISDAMVEKIYRVDYWNPIRGEQLPAGVDLATFDFGVNSGPFRAAKYLQAIVGAKQDGVVGPATLKAAAVEPAANIVRKLCAKRLSFVRGLGTFTTFGKGWTRRIADVEAKGVKMTGVGAGALAGYAKEAQGKATAQDKGAAGVGAAGGGAGLGEAATTDINWFIVAAVVVAGLALFALVKSRANINKERAAAYLAAAAE